MFKSFVTIMKHMAEKHSDSKWWGDSGFIDLKTGEYLSQRCQKCGEELVAVTEEKKEESRKKN